MGDFRSLEGHADLITLGTLSALFVVGGIGFLVVEDLRNRSRITLSVDTKLVLRTTAALIAVGFFVFMVSEWDATLAGVPVESKVLHSWFHSVTPRTAGFNSLPVSEMNEETQFFTIGLMFIGGGSGSTAGGIKVGTLAVLLAAALSAMRGREHSEATGREIRRADIDRALAVAFLGLGIVFAASMLLAVLEDQAFLSVFFETVSAFGTVGLSTGITPELSDPGLLLVTVLMFIGRLGPLTLALALAQRTHVEHRRLPEERVRVG
jgi:trk system potassium uptake protein TrkH